MNAVSFLAICLCTATAVLVLGVLIVGAARREGAPVSRAVVFLGVWAAVLILGGALAIAWVADLALSGAV